MSLSTKDFSGKQENFISHYLGWDIIPGSGALATRPGDIETSEWLGECKTHITKTEKICFKLNHWKKIQKEAYSKFKKPILFVDNGSQAIFGTWCIISLKDAVYGIQTGFPFKVGTNIIFNNEKLLSLTDSSTSEDIVFVYKDNNWDIALMPLCTFKKWFGSI